MSRNNDTRFCGLVSNKNPKKIKIDKGNESDKEQMLLYVMITNNNSNSNNNTEMNLTVGYIDFMCYAQVINLAATC